MNDDLILGSDFNNKRKFEALKKIKSTEILSDYFESVSKQINSIKEKVVCYDLTHSLGNFLQGGEILDEINSTKKEVCKDDFIISRLRSYLKEFAVVQDSHLRQLVSTEYLIYRAKTDEISVNTLMIFCLTKEVQTILSLSQYGSEHPRFYDFVFNELPIPKCIFNLNLQIETMVKEAHRKLDNSKMLYTQAQNILISELGLEDFNPSNEKVSIKTLKESFLKTGRLDSEYYQPKYDEILNKITKYGCSEFTNFVDSYTTGYPYSSDSYVEKDGIVLIKISNINNFKLDISSASLIPKNDIDLSAENVVQKNDILVSMSGTIGNSCIVQDDIKAVVNQRIMKIKSKNINPVVFSLIINSMIGKNQLERIQTGGVQANISPKDILKIQIPCIKTSVQDEIASYIKQSMEYSKKAKELLEISTKSVEIAIDKDEQAAHNFLEQNRTGSNCLL